MQPASHIKFFWPFGKNDSNPTIQKGKVVIRSAANPLGIHCSATTTNPFAIPSNAIPTMASGSISFFAGNFLPKAFCITTKIIPAIIHLMPANNIGGNSSTPIRMAR